MRTVTTTLFSFNELSEEAKQTAIESIRNEGIETCHYWQEARNSVEQFHDEVGTRSGNRSWLDINTGHIEDSILELSGNRLRTYLINNFGQLFYERKYRTSFSKEQRPATHPMRKIEKWKDGTYWITHRSNFLTESCCPLTGVCYDEDLIEPLKKFIQKPDERTFEDLLTECIESLRTSLENEDDYRASDEGITEDIEANDFEFEQDGTKY
ncbi:MAG: hypothetical protein ACPG5W_04425 [Flavobacteriales bacterium]